MILWCSADSFFIKDGSTRLVDKCQMMVNDGTIMNATNSFDHVVDPDCCFLIINDV